MGFYISKHFNFICDSCGRKESRILGKAVEIRKFGWAVAKDYRKCYCPTCRPMFISRGCCGKIQFNRL